MTVSQDGLVTATEIGKIFVVATCGGCQARCLITVYENIAIYAYDGLEWGNMMLYGYGDGGTEAAAWPGIRYDDKVEINGYQFYKFVLGPDWFLQGLRLVFNDGGNNRTTDYTNTWSYGDYYSVHVTGPFNEDGYATPVNIDNPYLFDPQPYNPDPNPFIPPEDALYYEGFPDTGEWVSGWTFLDVDGDGYNWESGDDITGHDGISGVLCSMSFDVTNRVALTPDNWAFTPAVQLSSEDNYLSFWLCGQDASYPKEHYAVYVTEAIPTGGNIASQCTILMEGTATQSHTIYTKAQSTWEHYSLHIPASFAGRQVYFGFRHFNTTDQFIIDVDDVLVTTYPVEEE